MQHDTGSTGRLAIMTSDFHHRWQLIVTGVLVLVLPLITAIETKGAPGTKEPVK
jgi:hypothetical protein